MPLPLQSDTLTTSEPDPNSSAIREQLRRLVTHALFTNSKRYPVLLAYIVEQTLDGKSDLLKERTIGVEAFGREPDYDVNLDPVVRTTAAEVRKRLALYYYSSEHAGESVIELPVGSYVPAFRSADARGVGAGLESAAGGAVEPVDVEGDALPAPAGGRGRSTAAIRNAARHVDGRRVGARGSRRIWSWTLPALAASVQSRALLGAHRRHDRPDHLLPGRTGPGR